MDKDKEAGLYGLVSGAGLFPPGEGQAKYYRMAEEKLGLPKTQILGILKQELKAERACTCMNTSLGCG